MLRVYGLQIAHPALRDVRERPLSTHLSDEVPVAVKPVFVDDEAFQAHGSARVDPIGRDTYLCAEPETEPVRESR